jgi:hypothetical protein
VLFLLAAGAKNKDEEHVGEAQLRGVCGEAADNRLREERRRGRGGCGRMMARGGTADGRRVCIVLG